MKRSRETTQMHSIANVAITSRLLADYEECFYQQILVHCKGLKAVQVREAPEYNKEIMEDAFDCINRIWIE